MEQLLTCGVCTMDINVLDEMIVDNVNDVRTTPCGHVFHYLCVTSWMGYSHTCPRCNAICMPHELEMINNNIRYQNDALMAINITLTNENQLLRASISELQYGHSVANIEYLRNIRKRSERIIKSLQKELAACISEINRLRLIIQEMDRNDPPYSALPVCAENYLDIQRRQAADGQNLAEDENTEVDVENDPNINNVEVGENNSNKK